MSTLRIILLLLSCAAALPAQQGAAPSAPSLRARLHEFARVLGNEGFKSRDGVWTGGLEGSRPRRLDVHLFAGNQYWFFAATDGGAETPEISLRNASGKKIPVVTSDRGGVAAAGVTAPATGRYALEVGGSAKGSRQFAAVYFFK